LKPGGAQNMRNRLKDYATSAVHLLDKVASVHDLRFVIFDNDTRLIFASTYDGGFEQYIKDFATIIPDYIDKEFQDCEGYPGVKSPEIWDYIARYHIHSLFGLQSPGIRDFGSHVYVHEDLAAVRHLFRVAAGLDSMILGETEITGQVKQAYDIAKVVRLTGGTLNRVFQTTFQAVKEIRSRTGIGRGATSVGSVAVQLAEKIFLHDLSKQSVIIIGAGQMGETCVRHLAKKGARSILVSNRSFDRAIELASQFGGEAVRFEECLETVTHVDIVVAATGCPNTLLRRVD